ncbi:hypothetical protein RCL1_007812 [Eukaryota sp. TZLM3-RCL]
MDKLMSKIQKEKRGILEPKEQICYDVPSGTQTTEVPIGDCTQETFVTVAPVGKKRVIREQFERIVEVVEPVDTTFVEEHTKVIELPRRTLSASPHPDPSTLPGAE